MRDQKRSRLIRAGKDSLLLAEEAAEGRINCVMPDQRGENSPAQHHESRDDSDQANFDAADVGGLLRIIRMQKAPRECGQNDREEFGFRDAIYKWNREKAKQKFFAGGGEESDYHCLQPWKIRAGATGVIHILRSPRTEMLRDEIKDDNVADMNRGH